MIKLEDLKFSDVIFKAYQYHWIMEYRVIKPKHEFDYQDSDNIVYCVTVENITDKPHLKGQCDMMFGYDEIYLFRTLEEAEQYQKQCKDERIDFLLKDNNLVKTLYEKTNRILNDADRKIYKELIDSIK